MAAEPSIDEIKRCYLIPAAWEALGFSDPPKLNSKGTCLVGSPFRVDKNPSFWIYDGGRRYKDLNPDKGGGGDVFDFVGWKTGPDISDQRRWICERLGFASDNGGRREKGKWRMYGLRDGSSDELKILSDQRGFSIEALKLAEALGFLRFRDDWYGKPAWCITDRRREYYEFRPLDGVPWPPYKHLKERKAHCYGSGKDSPVGIKQAGGFEKCVLTEGGPDFLAAIHFLFVEGKEETIAPLAMLGANNERINSEALELLAGRYVRLFPHTDGAGLRAAYNWACQLEQAGCRVDAFDLSGCVRMDGKAGKDLADLCLVDADCWEQTEKFRELMP